MYQEKIKRYMNERKKPQTAEVVAAYFLITIPTARNTLRALSEAGELKRIRVKRRDFYRGV